MKSYRSVQRGFTLVEILIVVIILGILAAIVIPQFSNASQDARKSSVVSQLQTLRSQIELYKLQHKDVPPTLANLETALTTATDIDGGTTGTLAYGPYMQSFPKNPLTNSNTAVGTATKTDGWQYVVTNGTATIKACDPGETDFVFKE